MLLLTINNLIILTIRSAVSFYTGLARGALGGARAPSLGERDDGQISRGAKNGYEINNVKRERSC